MKQYLTVLKDVLENGKLREDRTGVGTRSVFGRQIRFDLQNGFPLLTTKKMSIKSIIAELLWFIEGSTDERRLAEILFNKPRKDLINKKTIWTENANSEYWKPKANFEGDCGRIYGAQWRSWKNKNDENIDQLKNVIDSIKKDPASRRHLVVAFNPGELNEMSLPPCHVMFQFYIENNKLSCMWSQRSVDIPLGLPYNIASYAALTHLVAQCCNLDVGELIGSLGDCHIYENQIEGCMKQLIRTPLELCKLIINSNKINIGDFEIGDFALINYHSHDKIKFPFSV